MNSKQLINDLEEIIEQGLEDDGLPVAKGNSIRIKHIIIRKSPNGYLIYDAKENTQVARTMFKSTAIAIAKNLAAGRNITAQVLAYDTLLQKHYVDAIFYKNTIKTTKDSATREIRETRLNMSVLETRRIRENLDKFIFGS